MLDHPQAVRWTEDGAVDLLDQTALPEREVRLRLDTADGVAEAIRSLRVRGAPAIGIAAAMGLVAALRRMGPTDTGTALRGAEAMAARLRGTRPTAVNLVRALDRMLDRARAEVAAGGDGVEALIAALHAEATAIHEEDRAMCRRIGEHGQTLLPEGAVRILTHCNAGALATGGMGTALAPVYVAAQAGRDVKVYADETRPLLQGSRLTAWELARAGIDVTVVVDSVAASLMASGSVDLVLVGADRVAANGDVANKIGTYGLAVLARHHGIPFYVAIPVTTLDPEAPDGGAIPIEERDADEVRRGFGALTAPVAVPVRAPAFDVTPASLVTALLTDRGVLRPPFGPAIRDALDERKEPA